MKIAFFGDIVGKPGRQAVEYALPLIKERHGLDLAIANVENAAAGFGISERVMKELDATGLGVYTSGNHIWDRKEGLPLLEKKNTILRPANYPGNPPGRGYCTVSVGGAGVGVVNLQGRVFMPHIDCPFQTVSKILGELRSRCRVIIVDFHCEATSEKMAMGWFLDGKVSLLVGTHTHIPTKDSRILPKGTGYVTDVGMTGSYDSILGVEKEAVIERFLTMRPVRFEVARRDIRADVLLAEIDEATGATIRIEHAQYQLEE
ncbi:MAG: TIGR00282 family metallophosphoesterase [Chitinivibrionia bacterium]|nr:TIGR00282 family metallophosphoesterase [Chitinivibrionia bacterium]